MKLIINGGKKLNGEITLSGSKNAATKMMIASLLTDEPCQLKNFPMIGDTEITAELCRTIGSKVVVDKKNNILKIHTPQIKNFKVNSLTRRNRIPILALGPLLVRSGKAEVPIVGGDKIGPRPVDIHLNALQKMGVIIKITPTSYKAWASQGIHGAKINFRFPSIGATENIILAAVLANGRTTIANAATEPEIIELIKMLQKMGAIIELGANRAIYIDGVKKLKGIAHEVPPDRIEAASFACLAIATDGRVLVKKARQQDMITFLNALRRIGGEYEVTDEGIIFYRSGPLKAVKVETDTHPGFMTDWQQPFVALLTQANGISEIHETIYEDRFGYIQDLNLMDADIKVFSKCLGELSCRFNGKNFLHSASVKGPTPLCAADLVVRDLRSGMVNVIAALMARGQSTIDGIEEIDRGYFKLDKRLKKLGANIKRIA
ncbi:MAG: UDP-N-acetylglucosamine 1-carboxyvinyltransferase [Patescibacteria group bacterium]